jgi:hypothetical protein
MAWGKEVDLGNSPSPAITGEFLSKYFALGWQTLKGTYWSHPAHSTTFMDMVPPSAYPTGILSWYVAKFHVSCCALLVDLFQKSGYEPSRLLLAQRATRDSR